MTTERIEPSFLSRWVKLPITMAIGVLGVIYGLLVAFGRQLGMSQSTIDSRLIPIGAAVLGVMFLASLLMAARRA